MNYYKEGLKQLLELILDRKGHRLLLTHKDRLLRFGAELIFTLCETRQIEVVTINQGDDISFEEELAKDVWKLSPYFQLVCMVLEVIKIKNLLKQPRSLLTHDNQFNS